MASSIEKVLEVGAAGGSVTLVGRRLGPRLISIHGVLPQRSALEGERALTSAAAVRASLARTSQAWQSARGLHDPRELGAGG